MTVPVLLLMFALVSAPAIAAEAEGVHIYAAIADRVESGEIACCCPDLSDMAIGNHSESTWDRHFSGMVRLRWQLTDGAPNTGVLPWTRVQLNYHTEFLDDMHLFLGVGGDTETGNFYLTAPRD